MLQHPTSDEIILIKQNFQILPKNEIIKCLIYLRERISVPRDMSVHGAKQLRSYLNFYINELL